MADFFMYEFENSVEENCFPIYFKAYIVANVKQAIKENYQPPTFNLQPSTFNLQLLTNSVLQHQLIPQPLQFYFCRLS